MREYFKPAVLITLSVSLLFSGCGDRKPKDATPPVSQRTDLVITNDWKTLPTEAYKGKRDSISFVDENTGWYGTGKGDLFRTQDGGATWEIVASRPGTFIRAVAFLNEKRGFIGNIGTNYYPGVTDEMPLYETLDGGATWTAVDLGEETVIGICAIDVLQTERIFQGNHVPRTVIHAAGRVGGPAAIIRSVDGGASWSVIDMSAHAAMILDVKFLNENTGLVFASTARHSSEAYGLVLRTEDGGQTWTKVYTPDRLNELIWKASFPDAQTGYATVQSYDKERSEQLIIKTTDGGKTWQELHMTENPKARQFGIGFVTPQHGWVGTFDGGYYTGDGGKTFTRAPVARGANKFQVLDVPGSRAVKVFAIGTEVQVLDID